MYRYKKSVGGSYARQGYIYFASLCYKDLPESRRERIRRLCREVGGDHEAALLEFVTTDTTATAVCLKHYMSRSALYKLVAEYYRCFPRSI